MGGMIAQEIAINRPERVRKLIIGTAYACIDDRSGPTPEMFQAAHLPTHPMLDAMAGLMVNKRRFRVIMLPMAKIKNRIADTNSILTKRDAAFSHNTRSRLGQIKSPTLVITGTADRLIRPESSRFLAELIPGARLVQIDGGSHLLFIEMAKRFNEEVLKFLWEK
jgi:pimeloyl-ACP methyl ester carboxylesterase